jgi:DNA polymerase
MKPTSSVRSTLEAIRQSLAYYRAAGLTGYDCRPEALRLMDRWGEPPTLPRETLEAIRADLGDCRRCPLCSQRRHIVFGAGNPHARLMFVGEGPGQDEDQQGEPFVGAAGQLLTRIIQAIGLTREAVYIANVVKCRPPRNRTPEAAEIAICRTFLERQIRAVQPQFICALGSVAAQSLLASDAPISRLRGRFHDYRGIRLLPTFHPAFLLRNPERKREVWEDMKLLMREMGHAE